jgi:type I restriction enzyme R subunit
MNQPLTRTDLSELERMLTESGVGSEEQIRQAATESNGLGLFIRSLIGLDRSAAKQALVGFLSGKALTANQIQFVDEIVNHLTEQGVMPIARLYESPYTDFSPRGVAGLFSSEQVDELERALNDVRQRAVA